MCMLNLKYVMNYYDSNIISRCDFYVEDENTFKERIIKRS